MAITSESDLAFYINDPNNAIPDNLTTSILKSNNAFAFHTSLPDYERTPLIKLPGLAEKYGVEDIYVKDESTRLNLGAFKVLGASFAINEMIKNKPEIEIFCTATDGNHGRAVAWSASYFNKKSIVFVPKSTTDQRIKAIEKEGAIVELIDGNYDDTCAHAKRMSLENNWELVQDMSWENYEEVPAYIMAGYSTLFQELEETLHIYPSAKIDLVFLQAGVGSFAASGINYYLERYGANRPKIVIVEPREADAILASFNKGVITSSRGNSMTIMAGLNCGTPSFGAWDLLKNGVDVSIKIDDRYSKQAVRELYHPNNADCRIISGESGAAGLAGFISMMTEENLELLQNELNICSSTKILFISTEGATDENMFNEIINR